CREQEGKQSRDAHLRLSRSVRAAACLLIYLPRGVLVEGFFWCLWFVTGDFFHWGIDRRSALNWWGNHGVTECFRTVAEEAQVRLEAVQDVIDDLLLVHAVEVVAFRAGVGEDFHAEVLLHLRSRTGAEDWHGGFHSCDLIEEAAVVRDCYLQGSLGQTGAFLVAGLHGDLVAFLAEFLGGGAQRGNHGLGAKALSSISIWVRAQAGQTLADGAIRGVTTGGCFAAAASGMAFAVGSFHAQ